MAGAPQSGWFAIWGSRVFRPCRAAVIPAARQVPSVDRPIVYFDGTRHSEPLSVRKAFAGKHVMLIGVTGFIGKVWLVNTLMELPEIGGFIC